MWTPCSLYRRRLPAQPPLHFVVMQEDALVASLLWCRSRQNGFILVAIGRHERPGRWFSSGTGTIITGREHLVRNGDGDVDPRERAEIGRDGALFPPVLSVERSDGPLRRLSRPGNVHNLLVFKAEAESAVGELGPLGEVLAHVVGDVLFGLDLPGYGGRGE